MRDELLKAVKEAFAGKRKIRLTFKQWRCLFINSLLGMESSKMISLPTDQRDAYKRILDENNNDWDEYWSDINNRTITIEFTDLFVIGNPQEIGWFCDRLYEAVVSFEVIE